jgi:plastocyanin
MLKRKVFRVVGLLAVAATFTVSAAFAFLDDPAGKPAAPAAPAAASAPAAPAAAKKYPEQDSAKGWLEGKITLEGKAPEVKPPEIPPGHQDHAYCSMHLKQEKLIVSEKKELKDVIVSVSKYKPAEKVKPRECTLENKDCAFVPHVQATTVGSTLKILNSDKFLHNTHGVLALEFNNAVGPGQTVEKPIKKAGRAQIQCDFHSWMQGHIWIFEHDLFDVTGEDGVYRIPNIPPGEYEIAIWHEYPLAPQTQKVKIEAGKPTKLDVGLKGIEK